VGTEILYQSDNAPEIYDAGVPLCLGCLSPHSPLQYYCDVCGEGTGALTPYLPYVNIRYNYSFFCRLWKRLWFEPGAWASKAIYLTVLVWFTPIIFVGLPFVIYAKLKRQYSYPRCQNCYYNLTGNISGVCPECGEPIDPQLSAKAELPEEEKEGRTGDEKPI